ncbi:DUF6580 family putative transport protein [Myceligenerans pegani]|uniref:Uncharacterized protein n=1 Tax=Myceligenerans pegani TaxID=2776917 RepID=A0ABR9N0U8_9MICO|nr:DUF6580 family putative transport protein [Myceligenerans sp. TRM 65318]MBE1877249.1 hypothetical protein [Myceligenerans sp. TRM 65318]MBE3019520.1 hypothetical protein [Myceligenerans sp. TRM 65318]
MRGARSDSHRSHRPPARDLTLADLTRRWWRPAVAVAVVALAVVWRLVRADLGAPPNLELITAATFFAAVILRHRAAVLVPFAAAAVSDALLGNTSILLFTWTAWAVIGLGALLVRRTTGWRRLGAAFGLGIGGSVWFFLWTNFGVWLQTRGTFYAPGPDGLLASYVAGLPFFRTMLLGNLVLLPLAAGAAALVDRAERVLAVAGPQPLSR